MEKACSWRCLPVSRYVPCYRTRPLVACAFCSLTLVTTSRRTMPVETACPTAELVSRPDSFDEEAVSCPFRDIYARDQWRGLVAIRKAARMRVHAFRACDTRPGLTYALLVEQQGRSFADEPMRPGGNERMYYSLLVTLVLRKNCHNGCTCDFAGRVDR